MSVLNLTPILTDDQPSTHVRVGRSKIGSSAEVLAVKHNGRHAFFYADPEDDMLANRIGNKAIIHKNVAWLFGGVNHGAQFVVDANASIHDVPRCDSIEVYSKELGEGRLRSLLTDRQLLVHPIEEVVRVEGELARFTVLEMEPTGYPTLRIDEETEITFGDEARVREASGTRGPVVGPGDEPLEGEGGRGAESGPGGDEMDVDLDLTPKKPTKSFADDVAGLEEVKRTAEMLLALFDPSVREEVVERYGDGFAARGNSMLLYGPPGCGKTLVSEAIAHEAKYETDIEAQYGEVKFLEVKGSDILSKYPGEAERRVEAAFEQAHAIAREGFVVLFFDEVETLIPDRSDDTLQRHERSLTNAFLQEMNEVEDNLLVIGATNMPFTIDPAATRRFPIQQFIPQPDETVMAEVWRKHLADLPNADGIDFERLAAESLGYTPAEIADRVLGSELQRELVDSVVRGDPVTPDTEYLLDRLAEAEPKTVRQYVSKVRHKIGDLEGYPELRRYVEAEIERLDLGPSGEAIVESLLGGDDDA